MNDALVLVFAYLVGSVPTGVVVGRVAGFDVRSTGSGNIGATNVARAGGTVPGIVTLLGDVGKGFLAVAVAQAAGSSSLAPPAAALAVFFGHIFSIFLRFSGGKGVATALGVCLGLAPTASLPPMLVFAATFSATRIVSAASLAAATSAPLSMVFLGHDRADILVSAILALAIFARHRDNLRRLRAGTEPRFG
jgi:glycerol-3-phosphate acyltransferase PlsY